MSDASFDDVCEDIDVVIHTATMDERKIKADGKTALLINSYGTRQLYLDAEKNGVEKFIYLSTFHVYGKSSGVIDENTEPTPISDYGMTHYFAELYLKQLSFEGKCKVACIRLTNGVGVPLEGCDKWYLVINDFCKTLFETGKIVMKSNGLPLRDFVAIDDVVSAVNVIVNLKAETNFDVYNVSSENSISIRRVAELVLEVYEEKFMKKGMFEAPTVSKEDIDMVKTLYVSSEKLRKCGWRSRTELKCVIEEIFNHLNSK